MFNLLIAFYCYLCFCLFVSRNKIAETHYRLQSLLYFRTKFIYIYNIYTVSDKNVHGKNSLGYILKIVTCKYKNTHKICKEFNYQFT